MSMLRKKTIDTFPEALACVLKKLAMTDCSSKEIIKILRKKNCPDEIVQAVLKYLFAHNYINDNKLCENICEYWQKEGKNGKLALRAKLLQKGIAKDIVEQTLAGGSFDETEKAAAELLRYLKSHEINDSKSLAKCLRHMSARGFSYSCIRNALAANARISVDDEKYQS